MTAPHIVDPARVLGNLLTEASPDMMRQLLQNMINALLSADADAVCGAEWGQPSTGSSSFSVVWLSFPDRLGGLAVGALSGG